jgi:hypothetical protein
MISRHFCQSKLIWPTWQEFEMSEVERKSSRHVLLHSSRHCHLSKSEGDTTCVNQTNMTLCSWESIEQGIWMRKFDWYQSVIQGRDVANRTWKESMVTPDYYRRRGFSFFFLTHSTSRLTRTCQRRPWSNLKECKRDGLEMCRPLRWKFHDELLEEIQSRSGGWISEFGWGGTWPVSMLSCRLAVWSETIELIDLVLVRSKFSQER